MTRTQASIPAACPGISEPHHLFAGQGELSVGGKQGLFLGCVWDFRNQMVIQPWRLDAFALLQQTAGFRDFLFPASAI